MTKPAKQPAKELREPEKSLRFMQDPYQWPLMYLHIKRRRPDGGFPETAIMLGDGPIVYHVNPFELGTMPVEDRKKALDAGKEIFPDFEGIIDAGWVVD